MLPGPDVLAVDELAATTRSGGSIAPTGAAAAAPARTTPRRWPRPPRTAAPAPLRPPGPSEGQSRAPARTGAATIWVTHSRPGLDGLASAWLIRRRIDPAARFVFIPADHVKHVARVTGGYAYDIPGGDYGHRSRPGHRDACTFEILLTEHGLDADPALRRLAHAVGRVDTGGGPAGDELAALLATFVRRSEAVEPDDHALLAQTIPLLDVLERRLAGA